MVEFEASACTYMQLIKVNDDGTLTFVKSKYVYDFEGIDPTEVAWHFINGKNKKIKEIDVKHVIAADDVLELVEA